MVLLHHKSREGFRVASPYEGCHIALVHVVDPEAYGGGYELAGTQYVEYRRVRSQEGAIDDVHEPSLVKLMWRARSGWAGLLFLA